MINFRLATSKDIRELAELRYEYWQEDGANEPEASKSEFLRIFSQQITTAIENSQLYCWVATINEEIVSSLYIQVVKKLPKPSKLNDQFGYATNFYTVPEQRGSGIGKELLRKTKEWAASVDLEFIIAWPSVNSTELWNRENFKENESVVCEIRPYVN